MPATHHKPCDVVIDIAGHQAEFSVQIAYVVDPGNAASHDEPACNAFVEILAIRLLKHGDTGADVMPMLPKALVDKLGQEIRDEMDTEAVEAASAALGREYEIARAVREYA